MRSVPVGAGGPSRGRRRPTSGARITIHEGRVTAVEYQVRDARITDAERITALLAAATGKPAADDRATLGAADLLRQLVYLPSAVVIVAEMQRAIVGAAMLALRPSVAGGGFVGSIDLLVVEPGYEVTGVRDALVAEMLRSARNKGCVVVEAPRPTEAADQAAWAGFGFADAAPNIVCELVPTRALRT